MELSEQLRSLFSAPVEETEDSYVIEVPRSEVDKGSVDGTESYQVALLSSGSSSVEADSLSTPGSNNPSTEQEEPQSPPVSEGEERIVEITQMGDQGDGLTRVERGFVVIVPETEMGERVRITIETVHETVAFGEVIERYRY
jgi:predicted RNA-binding protein with TRAM domain